MVFYSKALILIFKMEESEKEKNREPLDAIWDSLGPGSHEYLNSNFKIIAPKLLEFLITRLLLDEEFEIGYFQHGSKKGAVISYNIYDKEKQMELRLDQKQNFELRLQIWDFDDEELEYKYKLVNQDSDVIPEGLKNLMIEIVHSSNPITVKSKSLK